MRLAKMLGPDGIEILGKLSGLDDTIVTRLCRALAQGAVGEKELAAARLAAKYLK